MRKCRKVGIESHGSCQGSTENQRPSPVSHCRKFHDHGVFAEHSASAVLAGSNLPNVRRLLRKNLVRYALQPGIKVCASSMVDNKYEQGTGIACLGWLGLKAGCCYLLLMLVFR